MTPNVRGDRPELMWTYQASDKVLGSPIVGLDNTLYFATPMYLCAVNGSGNFLWSYQMLTDADAGPTQDQNGTIYVSGTNGVAYYFNKDGGLGWHEDISVNSSFAPTVGPNGTIYFGTERYLLAMNPDGSLKWHFSGNTGQYSNFAASPAIAEDGTIYCTCNSGDWQTALIALSPDKVELCSPFLTSRAKQITPAIADDGRIYYVIGSLIYSLSADLNQLWWTGVNGSINSTPAITPRGQVVIVCSNGEVHSFDLDGPIDRWTYDLGGNIVSSVVSDVDGYVYCAGPNGNIDALTPDGVKIWSYNTGGHIDSQVAMGQNGEIFVGLTDGRILCLGSKASGNRPPTISGGSVWPARGNSKTEFSFTINYYDPDGEAPIIVSCFIDFLVSEMLLVSGTGTADNGVYMFKATGLPEGSHIYYFTATDASGAWVRYPDGAASFQGPDVQSGEII